MDSGGLGRRKLGGRCEYGNEISGVPQYGGGALHFLWYARIQTCTRYHLVHGIYASCCVTASTITEQNNRTTQDLATRLDQTTG